MGKKSSQFSVSTKPLVFAALLCFFMLTMFIVHRELIVFKRDLDRFETALYTQSEDHLRDEVHHIIYELDYSIAQIEATTLTSMETFLTQSEDNYTLFKQNDIALNQRVRYLINQEYHLDEGYYYAVFNENNKRLLFEPETNSLIQTGAYLLPLSQTDIVNILNGVHQDTMITTDTHTFLIQTRVIDSYKVLILKDYDHLLAIHKDTVLDTINQEYQTFDETPFIIGTDGHIYIHKYQDAIHDNIYDIDNHLFLNAFKELKDSLETEDEITKIYPFYTSNTFTQSEDHIAVATQYEHYDLIIGKSMQTSTFDVVINNFINTSTTQFLTTTLPLYILTILSAALGAYLVYRYTKKSALTIKQEEALYKRISNLSTQAIVIVGDSGDIVFANKTAKKIIGSSTKDMNRHFQNRLQPYDDYYLFQGTTQTYYVKVNKEIITYHHQPATLYFLEDVSNEVSSQKHLKAQVYKDTLTKLSNRRKLLMDYQSTMIPHIKNSNPGHLVIIDFDDFKAINDEHGHQYGDTALYKVAKVLRNYQDNQFSIYRIGGDEFACLAYLDHASTIRILESIRQDIKALSFKTMRVDFTYGLITIDNNLNKTFESYYDEADQKLYQFKKQKRLAIIDPRV